MCQRDHLLVAAHVRDDAAYIYDSITEFLEPGWAYGLKMQDVYKRQMPRSPVPCPRSMRMTSWALWW